MKAKSTPKISVRFWIAANAGLVALMIGAAVFGSDGVVHKERLSEELSQLKQLNEELAGENQRLEREVFALRHDDRYVEHLIRDELGWVRPDEVVFLFPSNAP